MAAPISTTQSADLLQYQTIITYLVAILDKEATLDSNLRQLSAANITKINNDIGKALDNVNDILVLADPTPAT